MKVDSEKVSGGFQEISGLDPDTVYRTKGYDSSVTISDSAASPDDFKGRTVEMQTVVYKYADDEGEIFAPGAYKSYISRFNSGTRDSPRPLTKFDHAITVGPTFGLSEVYLEDISPGVIHVGGISKKTAVKGFDPDGLIEQVKDRTYSAASHGFSYRKSDARVVTAAEARSMGLDPLGFQRVNVISEAYYKEGTIVDGRQANPIAKVSSSIKSMSEGTASDYDAASAVYAFYEILIGQSDPMKVLEMVCKCDWSVYSPEYRKEAVEIANRLIRAAKGEVDCLPGETVASVAVTAAAANCESGVGVKEMIRTIFESKQIPGIDS